MNYTKLIARYEPVITAIVMKYTLDPDIQEDCKQEARIGLLTATWKKCKAYALWKAGVLPKQTFEQQFDRYCRNIIRNSVLSYLQSYTTGDWYVGRTVRNARTNTKRREEARFIPAELFFDVAGIDDEGQIYTKSGRKHYWNALGARINNRFNLDVTKELEENAIL